MIVRALKVELDTEGYRSKPRHGKQLGNVKFSLGALYALLRNPLYVGKIRHREKRYQGLHQAIVDEALWTQAQDQLARNQHAKRTRENTKSRSLLAGLVFDDRGNAMSATQTHKG